MSAAWRYAGLRAVAGPLAFLLASGATAAQERVAPQVPTAVVTAELNVPAFRLDVWRDSLLIKTYAVAVGMRSFPTPTGDFTITRIIWNPWWLPPNSEWAKEDTLTPPGPTNPMGKVKLLIGEAYYLHGTPAATSIGRAASHGCVRMRNEDAVDLARLLQTETGAAFDSIVLDSLLSGWKVTRSVDLPAAVPIRVLYRLAEVRNDSLTLHRDIYRQRTITARQDAMNALAASGYDTTRVADPVLAAFLVRAARGSASVALDSLFSSRSAHAAIPRRGATRAAIASDCTPPAP